MKAIGQCICPVNLFGDKEPTGAAMAGLCKQGPIYVRARRKLREWAISENVTTVENESDSDSSEDQRPNKIPKLGSSFNSPSCSSQPQESTSESQQISSDIYQQTSHESQPNSDLSECPAILSDDTTVDDITSYIDIADMSAADKESKIGKLL